MRRVCFSRRLVGEHFCSYLRLLFPHRLDDREPVTFNWHSTIICTSSQRRCSPLCLGVPRFLLFSLILWSARSHASFNAISFEQTPFLSSENKYAVIHNRKSRISPCTAIASHPSDCHARANILPLIRIGSTIPHSKKNDMSLQHRKGRRGKRRNAKNILLYILFLSFTKTQ